MVSDYKKYYKKATPRVQKILKNLFEKYKEFYKFRRMPKFSGLSHWGVKHFEEIFDVKIGKFDEVFIKRI